jgi:hypothetical protein
MLTRKNCKWCDSPWHSKNKCPEREIKPLKAVYKQKGTQSPFVEENAPERPKLAYKGSSERSQLIGYADKFFSLYIRTRGGDGMYNRCYTCGHKLLITELQCGHFMSRRFLNTRWSEVNCHVQCNECNVEKKGNLKVYELRLRQQYGDEMIDNLKREARAGGKVTLNYIQTVIDDYKGLVF